MKNQIQAFAVLIAVLGVTGVMYFLYQLPNKQQQEAQQRESQVLPTDQGDSIDEQTYQEEVSYRVPNDHTNTIRVAVELDKKRITDITVLHTASSAKSRYHQMVFDEVYYDQVIGKPITEVFVTSVAGSTITTNAFNTAITNINHSL